MKTLDNRNKNLIEQKLFTRNVKLHDFAKYKILQSFGDTISNDIITIKRARDKKEKLAMKIREFAKNRWPRSLQIKKKESVQNSTLAFVKGWKIVFNACKSEVASLPLKTSKDTSDDNKKT